MLLAYELMRDLLLKYEEIEMPAGPLVIQQSRRWTSIWTIADISYLDWQTRAMASRPASYDLTALSKLNKIIFCCICEYINLKIGWVIYQFV